MPHELVLISYTFHPKGGSLDPPMGQSTIGGRAFLLPLLLQRGAPLRPLPWTHPST